MPLTRGVFAVLFVLFVGLHSPTSLAGQPPAITPRGSAPTTRPFVHPGLLHSREELEFVKRYLDIEQTRFEDRLTVSYDIDPDTLSVEVPAFLLQPLVENAIKHAIAPHVTPGTITITSRTVAHGTELIVRDTGPGILDTAVSRNGVGIANTRDRLETLYGRSDLLQLESIPGQGFTARVLIPDEPRTASTIPPRDADASHAHR